MAKTAEETKHQLTDVVSVTNFKGGVGKTTTVQTLAACLHKMYPQKRVIVMDLDPQCNLSFLLGWNDLRKTLPEFSRLTIYDAMTKVSKIPVYVSPSGIYYVPGSSEMQNIDVSLFGQNIPRLVLAKCVMQGYYNLTNVVTAASEAGVNIARVVTRETDLETYFVKLVGGESNA